MSTYKKTLWYRGSHIIPNWGLRLNGQLGVFRAIGDHRLENYLDEHSFINPRPKIHKRELPRHFKGVLVSVSDGILDVYSNKRALGEHIVRGLASGLTPKELAETIVAANPDNKSPREINDDKTIVLTYIDLNLEGK